MQHMLRWRSSAAKPTFTAGFAQWSNVQLAIRRQLQGIAQEELAEKRCRHLSQISIPSWYSGQTTAEMRVKKGLLSSYLYQIL